MKRIKNKIIAVVITCLLFIMMICLSACGTDTDAMRQRIADLESENAAFSDRLSELESENKMLSDRITKLEAIKPLEEKIIWNGTSEDIEYDDLIFVGIDKAFRDEKYSVSDFAEIDLDELIWLTELIYGVNYENFFAVDEEAYRQRYMIRLKDAGTQNVIDAIRKLEKYSFVRYAKPAYFGDTSLRFDESSFFGYAGSLVVGIDASFAHYKFSSKDFAPVNIKELDFEYEETYFRIFRKTEVFTYPDMRKEGYSSGWLGKTKEEIHRLYSTYLPIILITIENSDAQKVFEAFNELKNFSFVIYIDYYQGDGSGGFS